MLMLAYEYKFVYEYINTYADMNISTYADMGINTQIYTQTYKYIQICTCSLTRA